MPQPLFDWLRAPLGMKQLCRYSSWSCTGTKGGGKWRSHLHSMVWNGMVCYGMVWYEMVLYGMICMVWQRRGKWRNHLHFLHPEQQWLREEVLHALCMPFNLCLSKILKFWYYKVFTRKGWCSYHLYFFINITWGWLWVQRWGSTANWDREGRFQFKLAPSNIPTTKTFTSCSKN